MSAPFRVVPGGSGWGAALQGFGPRPCPHTRLTVRSPGTLLKVWIPGSALWAGDDIQSFQG